MSHQQHSQMTALQRANAGGDIPYPAGPMQYPDGAGPILGGYAVVYNVWSSDSRRPFKFAPGCFDKSIARRDVQALLHHNYEFPMGRIGNGKLELISDSIGLYAKIHAAPTSFADDITISIGRGDVLGMSPGWISVEEERDRNGNVTYVTADLIELSIVTNPAFFETNIDIIQPGAAASQNLLPPPGTLTIDFPKNDATVDERSRPPAHCSREYWSRKLMTM